MVALIDELEERGLCLRVQKPGIRRREYNIELTAKGLKALRECDKLLTSRFKQEQATGFPVTCNLGFRNLGFRRRTRCPELPESPQP